MKIPGIVPTTIDPGVKQKLDNLVAAVTRLSVTPSFSVTLPSASLYGAGDFVVVRASNGVSTLYVCFINSSGAKEWKSVTQSS